MEAIFAVLMGLVCLVLFYKVLSATIRLFITIAIAGAIIIGVSKLLGSKAGEMHMNFSVDSIASDISSTHCPYATESCISSIIKENKIVMVVVEGPYCIMCKVNKLLLVYNRQFADIAIENNVELIFERLENINDTYPESIQNLSGTPPFNIIFSEANPFGRSINRFLTHGYAESQIKEEVEISKLLIKNKPAKSHGQQKPKIKPEATSLTKASKQTGKEKAVSKNGKKVIKKNCQKHNNKPATTRLGN